MESHGCREHRRTSGNAQDEILHNSISPLGPNPEVHAENFLYIRWRKTIVGLQQKLFLFTALIIKHYHNNGALKPTITCQNV